VPKDTSLIEKCNYVIRNTDGTDFTRRVHKPAAQVVNEGSLAKS
jgi:hypothetical protein